MCPVSVLVEGGCGGSDDQVGELEEEDACDYSIEEESLGFELEIGLGLLVDCYQREGEVEEEGVGDAGCCGGEDETGCGGDADGGLVVIEEEEDAEGAGEEGGCCGC